MAPQSSMWHILAVESGLLNNLGYKLSRQYKRGDKQLKKWKISILTLK